MTDQPENISTEQLIQAWERQPGETEIWYNRFMRFCRMGYTRGILSVYNAERAERGRKEQPRVSGGYSEKVKLYDWKTRVMAWDRYIERRDKAAWEKKRIAYRKRGSELADLLIKKAEQMLQFPLARTEQETSQEGGKTIVKNVIEPMRWTMSDASRFLDVADRLKRLALEMETARTTTDILLAETINEVRDKRWAQIQSLMPDVLSEDGEQPDIIEHDDTDEEPIGSVEL